jgi:hypothetical protein
VMVDEQPVEREYFVLLHNLQLAMTAGLPVPPRTNTYLMR